MIIDSNFQTPPAVCEYMVNMIPAHCNTVLEPTPGLGNLVKCLEHKNRYHITTADDFFLFPQNNRFDCIVMNPPFSSKTAYIKNAKANVEITGMKIGYYILKQCMEMTNHVIALMPWYTIADSDVRLRHLRAYGIKSITHLPRKTFQYARVQTVIIELQNGYQEGTAFKFFQF